MSQEAGETTRLLEPTQPQYVFGTSISTERKRRVKQFQCCICTIFLIAFVTALVITVAYTIEVPPSSNENSTNVSLPSDESVEVPLDSFVILFKNTSWPLEDKVNQINITYRNQDSLAEAMKNGQDALLQKDLIEKNSPSLVIDSPSYRHQKVLSTTEKARRLSRRGYEEEFATRHLLGSSKIKTAVQKICLANLTDDLTLAEFCSDIKPECNILQKYRAYNGTCNNLENPSTYGVTYRPFRRALPPDYADGISKPRISKQKKPLPTARTVSLEVHRPYYRDDPKFTVMLAVWGQFLDHDITATAISQKENGSSISCCQIDGILSPECFPILIEKSDPFAQYNLSCMEFVRSAPAPTCCLGPREQMNQATAFIDGSVVYGNDETKVMSLRSLNNGLLKMYITEDNRTLLPISDDINDGCNREEESNKGRYCFDSGDARANENLHLTSMHLIWARQHNNLAKNLSNLNPHWDDERIFQESRRILAAQMQHITYNEFLPILLGNKLMQKHDLSPRKTGYFKKYNNSIDPSIANEFATAAFRFAHTIIPSLIRVLSNDSSSSEFIQMRKMLFDPFKLYQDGELDKALKEAMNTSTEASDSYFSNELKSHLFERNSDQNREPRQCGLDLVSLNLQRGRDHGLPGYVHWKEHCGLKTTHSISDLKYIMDREPLENIQAIYRDLEDIDLYTGALSEKPIKGSILGPTLTCLILDQFYRIKYGDRFYYESYHGPHAFSRNQLNEIRKTSLAGIICDNADHLQTIQPLVMERGRRGNRNVHCWSIPRANLTFWKEHFGSVAIPMQNMHVEVVN